MPPRSGAGEVPVEDAPSLLRMAVPSTYYSSEATRRPPHVFGLEVKECSTPLNKNHRTPATTVVAAKLQIVTVARRAGDHIADAAPVVEAAL